VASQIESEDGGNVGVGYAVPIETAQRVIDELLASGEVRHAYLGVALAEEPAEDGGVPLTEVVPGGPADDAGLRAGDVIVAIGGDEVASQGEVRSAVDSREPGATVEVRVRRAGEQRTVEVELGERPDEVQ
jgi:putative serine protease PepD